jgi:MinD-like ATPase involved in chromosome partitioning or flagellar assembly
MKTKKKFIVWTIKGGDGKTSIAAEIALRLDLPIITNEPYTTLDIIFSEERLLQLKRDEAVPYYEGCGMMFDFGGYIDDRVIDALKQCDFVLVPTIPEISDIQILLNSVVEIQKYNKNIVVIVNKTESDKDVDVVKNALDNIGKFPIFEIKKTRGLPNIYVEKKSISQMVKESKISAWHYGKVDKQFEEIVNFITK